MNQENLIETLDNYQSGDNIIMKFLLIDNKNQIITYEGKTSSEDINMIIKFLNIQV